MVDQKLARAAFYAALGGLWGIRGIIRNVIKGGESFDLLHLSTTLITFSVAGFVVGLQGDDLAPGTLEPVAAVVATVVDKELSPYLEAGINRLVGRTTVDV